MLNHLFATLLICLGVANTTPISNNEQEESNLVLTTPKKSNVITNYEIPIIPTLVNTQTYTAEVIVANTDYPYSRKREVQRYDIRNSNSYINVIGNAYRQLTTVRVMTDQGQPNDYGIVENKNVIGNNLDYDMQYRTELVYIYQLTPYNYNVETEINIRTVIEIEEWEDYYGQEWYNYEIYLIRNIYYSTENQVHPNGQITYEWAKYLNMQLTEFLAYNITKDIQDINNGFYYTKQQDLIQVGYNTFQGQYTDEINVQIQPNINNYYVVEYIPVVRPVNMGNNTQNQPAYPQKDNIIRPNTTSNLSKITGTNIIPDTIYEVVDIPGLMFEVLGMPFAFVSQAFNLTLFPGTPYQINIANLFLSIAAIFVFVWLLLLFIKMKG